MATIPALLALHIERALDHSETELVRSMARISINQTMLALSQIQHVPSITRGLPAFESVLAKKNLYHVSGQPHVDRNVPQPPTLDRNISNDRSQLSATTQYGISSVDSGLMEYPTFPEDFLGYDFLDRWQLEQLDFLNL